MDLEPTTPPRLYPIDEHDNLPLYKSATFCNKLQCQALAAAAGVFWQKPFFAPVNNQTRFFARCYDPNCNFIMRFNRKIKSDGTSIIWTLNDIKEHNCTTRLSDKPKNPPYSKPLLKFAILDELMDASVSQQTLATKLRTFIGCQPSTTLVSKVKSLALQFLRGDCTVRSIVRSVVRSIVCTMRALHCVSNEAAQWKTVVRSALHNSLATVSGAIPAWHIVFGIVRILFDGMF